MRTFDLVISFAGEDRKIAEKLIKIFIKKFGLEVFYDTTERAKLTGTFLPEYLLRVYRDEALYCAVLISKNYKEKKYPTHEWRAAQERAISQPTIPYIIPIRLDDTELPGLFTSIGYLHTNELTVRKIGATIYSMIKDDVNKLNKIRTANELYKKGELKEARIILEDCDYNNDIDALRLLEAVYGNLGLNKKKIEVLHRTLELCPGDWLANFILGNSYYGERKYKKALFHYGEAAKVQPKHPTIVSGLLSTQKKLKIRIKKRK